MLTMSSIRTEDPKKEKELRSKRNVLTASENQDMLNKMLERDEENFRKNGGFHAKTQEYILKRITEYPPFAEISSINTLGVDCNVVEVNELVAEMRWKNSQYPNGPAWEREQARRPKKPVKGFTPQQIKQMKQDKFDVDFWAKIRRGEYQASSFLNRITAIDDVAKVQKSLSKAEIIKTGNYRLLRKEPTPYQQHVSLSNWDKSILESWNIFEEPFPAMKNLPPDELPKTGVIKEEDPYSRYASSTSTNRYLHGNGGTQLLTSYEIYHMDQMVLAMDAYLVLAKEKRTKREEEAARAEKAEKRALAKLGKTRATIITATTNPTTASYPLIDRTYGDGGDTIRTISEIKPVPRLSTDARSLDSGGTQSTKKSQLPPLQVPAKNRRKSRRKSSGIKRQTTRDTLIAPMADIPAQQPTEPVEPNSAPIAAPPVLANDIPAPATASPSSLTALLFGPSKVIPESSNVTAPAVTQPSLMRRILGTFSRTKSSRKTSVSKASEVAAASASAARRRSSIRAHPPNPTITPAKTPTKTQAKKMPVEIGHDERLIATIMKARERQRLAATRFKRAWAYITGGDLEPKITYTVEDLMNAVTTGNYILAMDIIDTPLTNITPNTPSKSGDTALFLAVLLAHEGNAEEEEEQNRNMFRRLNCFGRNRLKGRMDWVVKVLLYCDGDLNYVRDAGGADGMNLLHYAVDKNDVELVEWLVGHEVDINYKTSVFQRTPLMIAALKGWNELVQRLLQCGALMDINAIDTEGCTALHYAALHLLPEYAQALMICGAVPNIRNNNGRLPVEEAKAKGRTEMVEVLLTYKDRTRIVQNKLAFLNDYHKNILPNTEAVEENEEAIDEG